MRTRLVDSFIFLMFKLNNRERQRVATRSKILEVEHLLLYVIVSEVKLELYQVRVGESGVILTRSAKGPSAPPSNPISSLLRQRILCSESFQSLRHRQNFDRQENTGTLKHTI